MNDRRDYSDIGERIASALQDAVETMDFGQINKVVTDSVSGAIEEVRRQVNTISQNMNGQTSSQQASSRQSAGQQTDARTDGASGKSGNADGQTQSCSERYRYTYRQPGSRTMYASQRRKQTTGAQSGTQTRKEEGTQNQTQTTDYGSSATALKIREKTGIAINRSGKVGGVLWTVFGGIGTGIFAILTLANLLVWAFKQTLSAAVPIVVMALLCVICGSFIGKGCRILSRLKRAERYAKLGGKKKFLELEDIARNTGRSIKKVRADVRRMLQLGIFPEGHMDSHESCLILDDETWQQYKLTRKEWENKKKLEDKNGSAKKTGGSLKNAADSADGGAGMNAEKDAAAVAAQAQAVQIIREGQAYMDRLRQLNIEIPGEVISNKLYQLDYLLTRVFAVIRQRPEKCPQMRKFMEYYLPTTVKLVESYADFDKAGVQGDNISSAKAEIEKTMDTINQAFEKLLDDFYQSAAMETAADAQVLKTLLAQDGYTKSDFDLKG